MTDRLNIARGFLREQLTIRPDIIGALLVGSVARGEATDTSDIDLCLYVHDTKGEGPRDLSCWRDGIYLEAGVVTPEGLDSLQLVMDNPIHATHIRDALILYDPTGFFGRLQAEVRAAYMEPRWVGKRIAWALDRYGGYLQKLKEAIVREDSFVICEGAVYLFHMAASVPLYACGTTPSSTRQLSLLRQTAPELERRIVRLECSLPDQKTDWRGMVAVSSQIREESNRKDLCGLPEYMIWKANRLATAGALRDGIDVLWTAVGVSVIGSSDRQRLQAPLREWHAQVGWQSTTDLSEKVRIAEGIWSDLEGMTSQIAT